MLFEPSDPYQLARKSDPETSHEAAAALNGRRVTETMRAILAMIRAAAETGMTDEQIAKHYHGPASSPSGLRTRRAELVEAGYVKDSGRRVLTRANRRTIVWVAV